MIIDTLANADKYTSVHPLFAQAFAYIKATDLTTIEVGKYEIADGLKAIVSDKAGMTAAESEAKFECHNQNIDIQVCIRGTENIGWKTRNECKDQKGDYNPEKDVLFFNDKPTMHFTLNDNQFVVFFPEDVHAPMIADGEVKKMVIKVRK
ncbi:YhcH/YjgK/YiaL family protein [Pedobacter arcticus]|uniref:YhcH/YjgK/YiaL family protein n=1 Tax=Pedobacter arcticus TaxID=752140 RepID=UPI0002FEF806|nr:YhcH/YjgK/YiaL family protein [Pedobacter arcticus]